MSWRRDFDAARDPYTARNALGITSLGGGGSGFITAVTAPLQVTGTTLSIDLSAYLTTATAAATYQLLDADLTAIAALTGTNTIYYRSAANTWSPVTVGTGLAFSGGNLTATTTTPATPTRQVFITGSGTYTTPANCRWIEVELVGGGACGGSGAGAGNGGGGGNTTFGTLTAGGGNGGIAGGGVGGAGGTASGGDINIPGGNGGAGAPANGTTYAGGGEGGNSYFGGSGGAVYATNGNAARTNSGSGGGGGGTAVATINLGGSGGGAGGYVRKLISAPAATYAYVVGTFGSYGTGSGTAYQGGVGGAGIIIVTEYY